MKFPELADFYSYFRSSQRDSIGSSRNESGEPTSKVQKIGDNLYNHEFYIFYIFVSEAEKTPKLNQRYSDADWHVTENTKAHHTDAYIRTDKSLVLRRGQSFKVNYF